MIIGGGGGGAALSDLVVNQQHTNDACRLSVTCIVLTYVVLRTSYSILESHVR